MAVSKLYHPEIWHKKTSRSMLEGLGRDGGHAHPGSASLLTEKRSHSLQAGLLTDGSSYSSSLPAGHLA